MGISEGEAVSLVTGRMEGQNVGFADINFVVDEKVTLVGACKGCTVGERVKKVESPRTTEITTAVSVAVAFDFFEFSWTSAVYTPFFTDESIVALAVFESCMGFGEGKVVFKVTRDVTARFLDISDNLLLPAIHPM